MFSRLATSAPKITIPNTIMLSFSRTISTIPSMTQLSASRSSMNAKMIGIHRDGGLINRPRQISATSIVRAQDEKGTDTSSKRSLAKQNYSPRGIRYPALSSAFHHPLRSMMQEFQEMENMMSSMWKGPAEMAEPGQLTIMDITVPSVDIAETDKSFKVKVDLPGLTKGDAKVEVVEDDNNNWYLNIDANKESDKESDDEKEGIKWHRKERSVTTFARRFQLPHIADENEVSAKLEDGVLSIEVLKKPEEKVEEMEHERKKVVNIA